ncbi:MAG: sodium:proton exchanger [Candidatus Epulonipiscioides saccharophilum]|nr:MAG: sodium:proton exchanger [Epulopiscium sp. AS2M-Bin001]
MEYIILLAGFLFLIKGADCFVDGASSIAKSLRVPTLIIGLTIVAFGTSAPELAVSVTSALDGRNAIAIGNVVGSNIFNILMVVGASAAILPLHVKTTIFIKELPFTLLASITLLVLGLDYVLGDVIAVSEEYSGYIDRVDGIILLFFFGIFLYYLVDTALVARKNHKEDDEIKTMPMKKSVLLSLLGVVGIVLGGQMVVDSASEIAIAWGMSEGVVGLTIVAIGTSLPEFVTSVVAATKGQSDLALGNVIGSNIFNIYLILGVSTIINPIPVNADLIIDMVIMIITVIATFFFALTNRQISRTEGSIFCVSYFVYMAYILIR